MTQLGWIVRQLDSVGRHLLNKVSPSDHPDGVQLKLASLSREEVLAGYDLVNSLYPCVPTAHLWRAWESAAYRRYKLLEPILDIGCGDGAFFQLVWPHLADVVGVDIDPIAAENARRMGVYREVHVSPAHQLSFKPKSFRSAFANCSIEHMDHLPVVLKSIRNSLCPGGTFLLSVVTDKFVKWATLPLLMRQTGEDTRAHKIQADYEAYHHLVNAFPPDGWIECLERAGFQVLEHVPLLPELTSRLFLFLDNLWHVKSKDGELGDSLTPFLVNTPLFTEAYRQILEGVLMMESDWSVGSGAVFLTRRRP